MCSPAPTINSFTNGFDGNTTTTFAGGINAGDYFTFTPTGGGITFTDKIRVYNGAVSGASYKYNGGSATSFPTNSWTTVATGGGTMTSFAVTRNGTDVHGWYAIEVDGKILVDQGATPASIVPAVDCRVTANQNAGFSVVKVDNPTATESRAHGLTQAPELILAKSTANAAENWHIFHSYYGRARYGIFGTNGFNTSDQWGSSEPDANQFFVKPATGSGANYAGGMIYYIWHSVPGYSSIGAFTGNGNADGPFVYTNHRPQWLLLKLGSANGHNWVIYDSERNPYNVAGKQLYPNLSSAEADASANTHARVDFLSNGFKIRGSHTSTNTSGAVILYASFASHPFKLSNAV